MSGPNLNEQTTNISKLLGVDLIPLVIESLMSIQHPRFFHSERGFQAELYAEMRCRLINISFLGCEYIVEQEYQKNNTAHGVTKRPDIIIHSPALPDCSRKENNLAVFELKLKATPAKARKDYENLLKVMKALHYPVGFFINISGSKHHIEECPCVDTGEIIAIAVKSDHSLDIKKKIGDSIESVTTCL